MVCGGLEQRVRGNDVLRSDCTRAAAGWAGLGRGNSLQERSAGSRDRRAAGERLDGGAGAVATSPGALKPASAPLWSACCAMA